MPKLEALETLETKVVELQLFDYSSLDTETRIVVQQRTSEIKALAKRTLQDTIDIGFKLIEVRNRLNSEQWRNWREQEFGWSQDTADRLMNVSHHFGHGQLPQNAALTITALYALASPNTPIAAREEALQRAEQGEKITQSLAKEIAEKHKPAKPEQTSLFEPGQRVQVAHERSPYDGVEGTVIASDEMIVQVETDEGEEISLLHVEVRPREFPEKASPVVKHNPIAGLQSELDIERMRGDLLEKALIRVIRAIEVTAPYEVLREIIREIKPLLG